MDVFILYKEDYPWDVRVEKLALSLKSDHNVTIVARNLNGHPVVESADGYTIRRLPIISSRFPVIRKLMNLPLWINPIWSRTLKSAISDSNNAIIIVRDLPLARVALNVARKFGIKVILDMAEVYPYMYASAREFDTRLTIERILKNPVMAEHYENSILPKLAHTFVMIDESRDRLLEKNVNSNQVTIISNTPPIDKFGGNVHKHSGTQIRLVYVGFITKLRGLDLLIQAVAEYIKNKNSADSIKIDIVGKGAERENLIQLVHQLKIESSVTIHGWLDQIEVNKLMSKANVGALTYRVCSHWNHTIPNKIFDYMLSGLPVLATEVIPIQRILNKTKSGLVCDDIHDIAKKLELLRSPQLRQSLGDNGFRAIKEQYNWAEDERKLHNIMKSLST